MTDDIKVLIDVDDTSVLQSIDRVSRLEKGYKKLDKALNSSKIDAQQYAKGVQQLDNAIKRATTSTKAFEKAQMAATKSSNRMGVVTQQAGYQVSDFIVQIQSGTNPFVAFSQQASQLVGVLPLVAGQLGLTTTAAIGLSAALGIAIPIVGLVGASLLTYFNVAKDAKSATETFDNSLSKLKSTLDNLDIKSLQNDFGRFASEVRDVELSVLDLKASLLRSEFSSAAEQLGADFSNGFKDSVISGIQAMPFADLIMKTTSQKVAAMGFEPEVFGVNFVEGITKSLAAGEIETAALQFNNLLNTVEATEEGFNGITGEGKELLITLAKIINRGYDLEKNTEEVLENLNNWDQPTYKATKNFTTLNGIQQKTLDSQIALFEASQELTKEVGQAGKEALILAGVDIAKPIDDATKSAAKLVTELGVSLGLAENLVAISVMGPERSKFGAKIRAGLIPPQAAGDFDVKGGETPFALQQYLDYVSNKNKDKTKTKAAPRDVLGDMIKEVQHKTKLLDLTEEQRRAEEIRYRLEKAGVKTTDERIDGLIKEAEAYYKLNQERDKQQVRIDQIGDAFGNMLMNVVDGTEKADEAFKSFMSSVLKQLFQETAIDPAVSFLKSFLLADGGVMSRGKLTPFANGGVVNSPTVFPMANGMGLMGEAGPEAIMPLKRGPDGKLGVEGGGGVTVVQNINVSTGVQQTVRTEIKSLMPQIAEASKAAVADAKRRGGSYGRNFA